MVRPSAMALALALVWLGALGTRLPAQAPAAAAAFKISGFAEASYAYSTGAVGNTIVGHLYDRFSDQFTLNAVSLAVERPAATDHWSGGVRIDAVIGQNADVLQSSGFELGPNGDITQLYITLNVPTANGNGVQLKLGKLVTLLGLEVIETVANPNWSEGNQFVYVENFTCTGLEVAYKFSGRVDGQIRISNGWDRVEGSPHKDVMWRLGLSPSEKTSIGLVGYYGPQQDASKATRLGGEVLIKQRLGSVSLSFQGDYGKEEANAALPDPTRDAEWWAAGIWLAFDATPQLGVAARVDYLDDQQGFRTSGAFGLPAGGPRHKLWSGTATLNVRSWANVLVRPEIRYDHSSRAPFDGGADQVVLGLGMAYVF
jgi:putative OmpL-like beta-barrel porin-2